MKKPRKKLTITSIDSIPGLSVLEQVQRNLSRADDSHVFFPPSIDESSSFSDALSTNISSMVSTLEVLRQMCDREREAPHIVCIQLFQFTPIHFFRKQDEEIMETMDYLNQHIESLMSAVGLDIDFKPVVLYMDHTDAFEDMISKDNMVGSHEIQTYMDFLHQRTRHFGNAIDIHLPRGWADIEFTYKKFFDKLLSVCKCNNGFSARSNNKGIV